MRRLFWLGVGAVAGASGTVWAERKVRSRLEQLGPEHMVVTAGNKARDVGRSVVDAVAEGRGAMREREAELRSSYDASGRAGGARTAPHRRRRPSVDRQLGWQQPSPLSPPGAPRAEPASDPGSPSTGRLSRPCPPRCDH